MQSNETQVEEGIEELESQGNKARRHEAKNSKEKAFRYDHPLKDQGAAKKNGKSGSSGGRVGGHRYGAH